MVFESSRFGYPEQDVTIDSPIPGRQYSRYFGEAVYLIAHNFGLSVKSYQPRVSVSVTPTDFTVAAGIVRAATVSEQRWEFSAETDGPRISLCSIGR